MDTRKLVVVGASLAGLRAAEAARDAGFKGTVTLIGAEPELPYDRPPLSKAYLDAPVAEPTVFRTREYLENELNVDLMLGRPATRLDTIDRVVHLGIGDNQSAVSYDLLIIATGALARQWPGLDGLAGVHSLRTMEDADAIRAALEAGARTVIIGAGFIGSEIASGARKRGLAPVLLEALPTPLVRAVGEEMGARLSSLHAKNGTDLRCGVSVSSIEGEGKVQRVVLSDGSEIEADLVVTGLGSIPSTGWLDGSGLVVENGVVCDEYLRTNIEGIYAAGDVLNWYNPTFERHMRIEHWTSAAEQGSAAARNAVNPGAARPYATVPFFWSDQYGVRIQFAGVSACDEVLVVEDSLDDGGRLVALYRSGDMIVGAMTVDGQTEIMKYRGMIMKKTNWGDAVDFAERRTALYLAKQSVPVLAAAT